jgi:hypothetical protein
VEIRLILWAARQQSALLEEPQGRRAASAHWLEKCLPQKLEFANVQYRTPSLWFARLDLSLPVPERCLKGA